jgi:predicted nucleic acid-binding protein
MNQRIYIDTSVVGGYFDKEFEVATKLLFDRVFEGKVTLVLSELLKAELVGAPEKVKSFFDSLPKSFLEFVELSEEAKILADKYIAEDVVGRSSLADCQHIAIATLQKVDVLVSWNFKHIVNLPRIRGYNSINMREGLQILEIRSPKEIFSYE